LARNEGMDHGICQRVCYMPAEQDTHAPESGTSLSDTDHGEHVALLEGHNGSNHRTTTGKRKGHNTHNSGSRMFTCGYIPAMQYSNMGPGITQLYHDHIFRWFGLPTKIISDRDPWFTSHFGKAFTAQLGIEQNLSTAFHLQTDGLLECKNQWIEQYLRLVSSAAPEDWMYWLVLALTIHNNWKNVMTGLLPNQILLGYDITLNPWYTSPTINELAKECHHVMME
jgi:hypothetical protein